MVALCSPSVILSRRSAASRGQTLEEADGGTYYSRRRIVLACLLGAARSSTPNCLEAEEYCCLVLGAASLA